MPTYLVLLIAAAAVVALFVAGMSLTLMIKGHHIRSEIADNPNLRKLGLDCAIREALREEGRAGDPGDCLPFSCGTGGSCADC